MKVVVTGGAGFIGSHVVKMLIHQGYKVIIVDNLSSTKGHCVQKGSTFYQIDVGSQELFEVFETERPDYVIHLASQIHIGHSLATPVRDANKNISGTLNVLQCVKKYPVTKIVYTSSAAVYGEPELLPIDESHPIAPVSFSGLSKYIAEIYFRLFSKLFGIDYVILRCSNVYGPKHCTLEESGVISVFYNQILNGKTPIIYGNGSQTRDFVHVEDVAAAHVLALTNGHMDVLNISCNQNTSILELVDMMREIAKFEISPVFRAPRQGDIERNILDNQKADRILGWRPTIPLFYGLQNTILQQQIDAPMAQIQH